MENSGAQAFVCSSFIDLPDWSQSLSSLIFGNNRNGGVGLYFGERAARGLGADAAQLFAAVSREIARDFGQNFGVGLVREVLHCNVVWNMNCLSAFMS